MNEDDDEPLPNEDRTDADDWTHEPVLLDACLRHLQAEREGSVFYDLTLGLGGHTRGFLERGHPTARAFGVDGDPLAIERTAKRLAGFGERLVLQHANLRRIGEVARERGWPRPTAVLMDLGLSSPQIEEASRGFSYRRDGPLDMRFDPTTGLTAAQLLLALPSKELAGKLRELGDEPLADEIVRLVKRRLPVDTTDQLRRIVEEAYAGTPSRTHPARRTFQALRILVNEELEALVEGLRASIDLLRPGGRVVVLSYHSGEDRLAKQVIREAANAGTVEILARRPERAGAERFANQRARSVKLRVAEKLGD